MRSSILTPRRAARSLVTYAVLGLCLWTTPARADETQACIDASDKGQILRIDKRLREARGQFAICAERACPSEIRERCAQWLDETQRAIPAIVFVIKDANGNDVSAAQIAVDGAAATERYDGTAFSLNPGEHAFRFEAAGAQTIERTFRLVQGERSRQEKIVMSPAEQPRADTGTTAEPTTAERPSSPSGLRMAGVVVGGVGLAGVVLGGVLGLAAIATNNAADCNAASVCADPASRRSAQRVARASTASFIAGGALVVGGVVLFVSAPKPRPAAILVQISPLASRSGAGLFVEGAW